MNSKNDLIDLNTQLLELLDWDEENFHHIMEDAKILLKNVNTPEDAHKVLTSFRENIFQYYGVEVADLTIEILLRYGLMQISEEIEA